MTDRRPGPRYSEFFRRLRTRPLSSWAVGERAAAAHAALAELAALGWVGAGPVPPVPDLGPHALADQLQVLAADVLTAETAETTGAAGAAETAGAAVHTIITTLAGRLSIRLD
ncbi:MAG: hypothetical protein ABJA16_04735 [Nakamurella sp.]